MDILFVTACLCVLMAVTIPHTLTSLDRSRGLAAARYLASRMALARVQAVSRSSTIALWFNTSARGIGFSIVQDGNRNGVRSRDIQTGVDRVIEAHVLLSDLFPGVDIGLAPETTGDVAVQAGGNILSFTPSSTSTSGTIYVRGHDKTQWAVRILGATARARVLRYAAATGEWVYAF